MDLEKLERKAAKATAKSDNFFNIIFRILLANPERAVYKIRKCGVDFVH